MVSKIPVWKGSKDFQEDPSSPAYSTDKSGPKYTRVFRGPFDALVSSAPARLSAMKDVPAGMFVDTVTIQKSPGGVGVMTVTLSPAPRQDFTFSDNVVLELEWTSEQKKLETHPIFRLAIENPDVPGAGSYPLKMFATGGGPGDYDKIEAWKNETDPEKRALKFSVMTDNQQAFVERLAKGEDSYMAWNPVIRQTTKNAARPNGLRCGMVDDPPSEVKVEGYTYIRTSDRVTLDRTWTRVIEWTGFDSVDTEIYS